MDAGIHGFLVDIWFGLVGLILMLYVVLDGFDLGVGILSFFGRGEDERGIMMATLGSVWDGNETWLVVLGGALFGAFPIIYGVALHGLYVPIMAMIFGLIFRAVAFEFRENARRKLLWNLAFAFGSLLAAVAQGFALGAIVSGLPVVDKHFAGTTMGWFSGFAALVAGAVVAGYVLLGATYLVVKTTGRLQERSRRTAVWAAWITVALGIGISIWTPLKLHSAAVKWFGEGAYRLGWLPALAGVAFLMLLRSLHRRREVAPFVWSVVIFVVSLIGLAASLFPYVLPPSVDAYSASASSKTLVFMLTGVGFLIPIMLVYNAYQYLVFRGKVTRPGYDPEH